MGLTIAGADKMLNAITGQGVTAAGVVTVRLHTGDDQPASGNELSGGGYDRRVIRSPPGTLRNPRPDEFTRGTLTGYRRLLFPEMVWFSSAEADAQTANSVGLWHDDTLMWWLAVTVVPQYAEVKAGAGAVYAAIEMDDPTMKITEPAADKALRALAGEAVPSESMLWELHWGGAGGAETPAAGNRITGGGITSQPAAWASPSTVAGHRRFSSNRVTWSSGLTADTNQEPSRIALWAGDPAASGVLHAWRVVRPSNPTEVHSTISIALGALYLELLLAGAGAP